MFTHQMHSMLTNTVDRLRDRDLLLAEEVSMSIANPKTDFFELPLLRWELGWKTKSWSSLKNEDDDLNSNFSSNVTRRKGPKLKHLFVFSIREREKEREKERKRERERERERERRKQRWKGLSDISNKDIPTSPGAGPIKILQHKLYATQYF